MDNKEHTAVAILLERETSRCILRYTSEEVSLTNILSYPFTNLSFRIYFILKKRKTEEKL